MPFTIFGLFKSSTTETQLPVTPKKVPLLALNSELEWVNQRRQRCNECEHRQVSQYLSFVSDVITCRQCGCALNAKTKISISHCPLNHW